MKTILLMIFATFLSSCKLSPPSAPILQRCAISIEVDEDGIEKIKYLVCNDYKFDVVGGLTIEQTESRLLPEKELICFPLEKSWIRLTKYRDKLILWGQKQK